MTEVRFQDVMGEALGAAEAMRLSTTRLASFTIDRYTKANSRSASASSASAVESNLAAFLLSSSAKASSTPSDSNVAVNFFSKGASLASFPRFLSKSTARRRSLEMVFWRVLSAAEVEDDDDDPYPYPSRAVAVADGAGLTSLHASAVTRRHILRICMHKDEGEEAEEEEGGPDSSLSSSQRATIFFRSRIMSTATSKRPFKSSVSIAPDIASTTRPTASWLNEETSAGSPVLTSTAGPSPSVCEFTIDDDWSRAAARRPGDKCHWLVDATDCVQSASC